MRSKIPHLFLAVLTVLALGGAALSIGQARSTHHADTVLTFCGAPATTPRTLVISCADANSEFSDLRWYAWGDATAYATGVARWNDCTPTCVAGTWKSAPVTVWAWDLRTIGHDTVYTKVRSDSKLLAFASIGRDVDHAYVEIKN